MFNFIGKAMQWSAVLIIALLTGACGKPEEIVYQPSIGPRHQSNVPEYVVGVHPLHNPQRLMELYGPIVDYLNIQLPEAHFRLETSRNYAEFDKKLYAGHYAFAMSNPYQAILSLKHGYRIFGKMADDSNFQGIMLVRKDSGIHSVADLKGKAVSYPAETALAATMLPQYYLQTHGLDVNLDIENRYVGSQESSIMNVYRGHVAAGATWPVPWQKFQAEHPDMSDELKVQWTSEMLVNNAWVVRNDIPAPIVEKLSHLLFSLQEHEGGRRMLKHLPLSRFEPATEATYQPVRDFLQRFSKSVRQIEY